jgi:hypothetical protein
MLPRLTLREILSRIAGDVRRGLFELLWFEVLFKAATLLAILPLLTWGFRWVVSTSGHQAVGNLDILAFLLLPRGLLAATTVALVLLTLSFAETAGLICIGYGLAEGRRVTYLDALRFVGLRLGRIMRVSFLGCTAALLLAAPFVAGLGLVYRRMLSVHDINYYIATRPPEAFKALWLAGALIAPALLLVLAVYLVASYALPGALFAGRPVRTAYATSLTLLRQHGPLLAGPPLVWLFLWSGISAVANWIGLQLGELMIAAAGTRIPVLLVVLGTLLVLDLIVALVLGFLLVTVSAALIARLYREACERSSIAPGRLDAGRAIGEGRGRWIPR